MKIAIATLTKESTSQISTQAGRSPFYILFDEAGAILEVLKNPFSVGGGGAGFGVAKMLSVKEVTAVAGGKLGANMIGALKERNIQSYEMEGTAQEALQKILKK